MPKLVRNACPACRKRGEDTKGDNLVRYENPSRAICFACGYKEGEWSGIHSNQKEVDMPLVLPLKTGIPSKNIPAIVCRVWDVSLEAQRQNGGKIVSTRKVVFPYYNEENSLVGVKFRDFTREASTGKKTIYYDGSISFFGLQKLKYELTSLFLWEGETDTLSAATLAPHLNHIGYPGVSTLDELLKQYSMLIRRFDRIYIAADNDEAGRRALEVASELLPVYKSFRLVYPSGVKDLNEILVSNDTTRAVSVFQEMTESARPLADSRLS